MQQVLQIHEIWGWRKDDFAGLKSETDDLDIDKLKNVPNGLSSFKSKLDKLDIFPTRNYSSWSK